MKAPKVKLPAVSDPSPIPEVAKEVPEEAVKRARRRKGYESTFKTGLTPQTTGKKLTLG